MSADGPLAEVGRPGAPMCVVVCRDEELQIASEPLAIVRRGPPPKGISTTSTRETSA